MKKYISAFIAAIICAACAYAKEFSDEKLSYRVEYKWGLINKTAGSVHISLQNRGDRFISLLTASSAKWADKFYKVRDTLHCEVIKNGFKPVIYKKNSHEGGDSKIDVVKYSYNGSVVTGSCTRKKWTDGALKRDEQRLLQAEGTTVDMLSAFYYMRSLPYRQWDKGHVVTINIFSGKRKELLTIKYLGEETIEIDKKRHECHRISFIFTSDGKKKTSDDMEAWISTAHGNIPLKLEGKLPIGKIRCFYTGA